MNKRKVKWGVLGTATIARNHTIPGMLEAKKKKHILCEKPLAPTADEVREVVELCRQEGVLLMEAFAYLHSPAIQAAAQDIANGEIGKPLFVETVFMVKPWAKEDIRMRRETLGGCTYDLGCYNLSLILRLLGEAPDELSAHVHYMENGVDDFSSIFLHFPSGARAYSVVSLCAGQRADRFFVHGSDGILEAPIPYNAKGTLHYCIHRGGTDVKRTVAVPSNYRLEVEQFGRCIAQGETPLVTNAFSIQTAQVLTDALGQMGYFSRKTDN